MKLEAFNVSDGTVEIHKAGCADIKRNNKGSYRRSDKVEFGKVDWPTKYAFMYDYWNNGILEEYEAEHGEGSFDVAAEMDWKPCTSELPYGTRSHLMNEEEVTVESHKIGCRDNNCHGECLGCSYEEGDGRVCIGIANHTGDHVLRGTVAKVEPAKRGANAVRKEAREVLWSGILGCSRPAHHELSRSFTR